MQLWAIEYRVNLPKKGVCWLLGQAKPERLEDGSILWHGFITSITELKLSEQHLKESRMLRRISEEAREEERKHIAREIHDELGQLLSVMRMSVSTLDLSFGEAIPDLHVRTEKIISTIDSAISVARGLATSLRPAVLNSGIVCALEWMVEDYAQGSDIDFQLNIATGDFELEESRAVMLFRIVQGCLTNVVRHAKAEIVEISLGIEGDFYTLEVQDNGVGFDPIKSVGRHSYGIVGMKERALLLGCTLGIVSELGVGTRVKLCIPILNLIDDDVHLYSSLVYQRWR